MKGNRKKLISIRKIAVTGGKGGTGKSTFAILLFNELVRKGKKVILCDCDVECPNDYLLLGKTLKKPKEKAYIEYPKLDKRKCQKCGLCADVCKSNAIFAPKDKYPVFIKDLCSGCSACWVACPFGAIKPKKEEVGKIYLADFKFGGKDFKSYLITGAARPGLEETGVVVRQVKEFALKFAEKVKADYILFDTAAGMHCPVISALLGTDMAYCVTEPTPMGSYDLSLILDLCEKLKVKTKIVLNQSDLGDKKRIKKVAKKFKIPIVKEIPYSEKLAKAYSKGELLNYEENI